MDFQTAIVTCFRKYADVNGRAPRSEYWWFFLFNTIVGVVLAATVVPAMVFKALMFLPTICVSVRRLHDIGKVGWWLLAPIAFAIGIVFFAIASGSWGWLVLIFFSDLILIPFFVAEGNKGQNQFGDDPLASEQQPVSAAGVIGTSVRQTVSELKGNFAQTNPAPSNAVSQTMTKFEKLKKLGELRNAGIFTEEEFAAEKKKILEE